MFGCILKVLNIQTTKMVWAEFLRQECRFLLLDVDADLLLNGFMDNAPHIHHTDEWYNKQTVLVRNVCRVFRFITKRLPKEFTNPDCDPHEIERYILYTSNQWANNTTHYLLSEMNWLYKTQVPNNASQARYRRKLYQGLYLLQKYKEMTFQFSKYTTYPTTYFGTCHAIQRTPTHTQFMYDDVE